MSDLRSYRTEPDLEFANRLEVALLERLSDVSILSMPPPPRMKSVLEIENAPLRTSPRQWIGLIGGALAVAAAAAAMVIVVQVTDSDTIEPTDNVVEPLKPFVGDWVSIDTDNSTQSLEIRLSPAGQYEILLHDDWAGVCSGARSTISGAGQVAPNGALVIARPVFTCDDGSTPVPASGPSLDGLLVNFTFTYDIAIDALVDSFGVTWRHASDDTYATVPSVSGAMWPQSNLDEVQEAQRLADEGDPRYTWQVDSDLWSGSNDNSAEILARFIREVIGWDAFYCCYELSYDGDTDVHERMVFVRCAAGETTALNPADTDPARCAPTRNDFRYEAVRVSAKQLGRSGATGIWTITEWESIDPAAGAAPPSDAEVASLLEEFFASRVNGVGAEEYLVLDGGDAEDVPLLYATTGGAAYERFEYSVAPGHVWPYGWLELTVRLFADGGQTVVDQNFTMKRGGTHGLYLEYPSIHRDSSTSENGQPYEKQYSFLDGEVTFGARYPWIDGFGSAAFSPTMTSLVYWEYDFDGDGLVVLADPLPLSTSCQDGPEPADLEDLVRAIRSNTNYEMTEPVRVRIDGVDALMMDATLALEVNECNQFNGPSLFTEGSFRLAERMRIYVLSLPGEGDPHQLAIVVFGNAETFDLVLEAATPVIESFKFHTQ